MRDFASAESNSPERRLSIFRQSVWRIGEYCGRWRLAFEANFLAAADISHDNGRHIDTVLCRAVILFSLLSAFGLVAGADVLGVQTKNIGSQRSTVMVKGLA